MRLPKSVEEDKRRLAHLGERGSTEFAFTFQSVFAPEERFSARD